MYKISFFTATVRQDGEPISSGAYETNDVSIGVGTAVSGVIAIIVIIVLCVILLRRKKAK